MSYVLSTRTILVCALTATLCGGCPSDEDASIETKDGGPATADGGVDGQAADASTGTGADSAVGHARPDGGEDEASVPTPDSGEDTDAAMLQSEADWLIHMREEEKLARDVYRALASMSAAFANIAASEQQHMDAVLTLLNTYGISDPAAGKADGEFRDVAFQELYTRLVTAGAVSVLQAYTVGATVEELDIHDLMVAQAAVTHADVDLVFKNLSKGSRNHLRTFDSHLKALGATYAAQYLDQATYDSIVAAPMETGPSF